MPLTRDILNVDGNAYLNYELNRSIHYHEHYALVSF